jgi:predicted dehydrogenase
LSRFEFGEEIFGINEKGKKMNKVKIGVIGCGNITAAHMNALKSLHEMDLLENVTITALCDRNYDQAFSFRKKGEGPSSIAGAGPADDPMNQPHVWVSEFQDQLPNVYSDYKKMFEEADINTVYVLTPVFTHHQIGFEAIERGFNVYFEKPLAISVQAGKLLVEKAVKAGVVVGVAENYHFLETVQYQKWAIDNGYLGTPQVGFSAGMGGFYAPDHIVGNTAWRHAKLQAGGGVSLDAAIHGFHELRYRYGDVSYVNAETSTLEGTRYRYGSDKSILEETNCNTDDIMIATLRFKSGMIINRIQSWAGKHLDYFSRNLEYGTKGVLEGNVLSRGEDEKIDLEKEFEYKADEKAKSELFPHGIKDSFMIENLDFLDACRNGTTPILDGVEGVKDLAVSFAVLESSYLKKRIFVNDIYEQRTGAYEKEINEYCGI